MSFVARFRAIVDSATPVQIVQAAQWYSDANSIARELSLNSEYTVEQCASVIAAFSPRMPWARNVYVATEFVNGNKVGALPVSIRNAEKSLTMGFDALNGDKTNAFARNIAGDLDAVTIDVWMIRAAGMDKAKINKSEYRELANAVTEVANELTIAPAIVQALIWIIVRGKAE